MTQLEWKIMFSDNLCSILNEKGMTQADLARDSGLSPSRINEYIKQNATPTVFAIINIAYALDIDVNELIDFDERIY
jgi:transcriptional regulator with XRE-family HTH domain